MPFGFGKSSRDPRVGESIGLVKGSLDPAVRQAADRAIAGDWQALESFLLAQPSQETRDDAISAISRVIDGRPDWLDYWARERRGHYIPLVFRGDHAVGWAWEARGNLRAKYTSQEAFEEFARRLPYARDDLEAAAAIAPAGDAAAWVFQISMSMGLGYPLQRRIAIFNEVQSRFPWHPIAVGAMVQAIAPKWSGSLEMLAGFSASLRGAPEGSRAHVGVLEAHFEIWQATGVAGDYWRRPDVAQDVMGAAARSIYSPAYVPSARSFVDHNWFMYAFAKMGERDRFLAELDQVRGRLGGPFRFSGDAAASYLALCRQMKVNVG